MICFYTKFHMSSFSGSLASAIRLKAKRVLSMHAMLFYILLKISLAKVVYLCKIYYHTSFLFAKLSVLFRFHKFAHLPYCY
jgi:hypothetical protein